MDLNPFDNIGDAFKKFVKERTDAAERRVKIRLLRIDAKYHKFRADEATALADKLERGEPDEE